MHDYRDALTAAIEAAREAGAILREGLGQLQRAEEFTARAEAVIRQRLLACRRWHYSSRFGQVEAIDDHEHAWRVEANDGAASYAKGWRGSAVVIAASILDSPRLCVIYAFAYPDHEGDLIAWADGCGPVTRNGEPVDADLCFSEPPLDDPTFFDGLIVYVPPEFDQHPHAFAQRVAPARFIPLPSVAYRSALAAVGEGIGMVSVNESIRPHHATRDAAFLVAHAAGGHGAGVAAVRHERLFAGEKTVVTDLMNRPWDEPLPPPPPEPGPALVRPSRYPPARLSGRVIADAGLLARAQGCLLGQAIGDALGGLVEFKDRERIERLYPDGCRELHDGGTWNNLAGQPTDDTEMALLLARSIVHAGRYDREEVIAAYIDWKNDPRTFDIGNTIRQSLSAASQAPLPSLRLAFAERGANRQSQANGSLMRISPLAIYAAGRPDVAAEMAMQESLLTHPHPVCGHSCAVFTAAIAKAIATGCGPAGAYEEALRQADRLNVEPSVRDALGRAKTTPPDDYYSNQGWVMIALRNAFYQLLNAPTVEEGIVATVRAGGDTDTNGAIAGALLAAVHGRKALPPRWVRTVLCCRMTAGSPTDHKRAREYWPCDVMELAELLLLAGRPG